MEMKSISGQVFYVQDMAKTVEFYDKLGFRFGDKSDTACRIYLNWYSIDFVAASGETKEEFRAEATTEPKGAGQFTCIKVDDVDAAHAWLKEQGFEPSSEPRDWPWGNREFVLRDPDGYKLVFWQKSK